MSRYPIIFQISPPRSGSTAALRCIEAQGIFEIYHEPSIKPYELKTRWGLTQFLFRPDHPINTFEHLEGVLLERSKYSPVYVKDIAYSCYDWLSRSTLLNNPQVHFIFLVRHPYHQLVSLYRQFTEMGVPPRLVHSVYDYELLERLINLCRRSAYSRTRVIQSECLSEYPELVIRTILEQAGLEVKSVNLSWAPKCSCFDGSAWHESKKVSSFRQWHHDAMVSTSFQELPCYPQDWSQFSDKGWAQQIIRTNYQAYRRIFNL